MISKHIYRATLLSVASGLPYVVSNYSGSNSAEHAESALAPPAEAASERPWAEAPKPWNEAPRSLSSVPPSTTNDYVQRSPAAGLSPQMPGQRADLGQYINFAVTPAWVLTQWPRVSASLAEIELQGYRVPLVTGTQIDDLAGSLSYYFDRDQRVARISFSGSTGDPRRLITLVTGQFGFVQDATDDPAVVVYAVKWNKKAHSELRIRPVKIVRAEDPRNRYDVEMTIRKY